MPGGDGVVASPFPPISRDYNRKAFLAWDFRGEEEEEAAEEDGGEGGDGHGLVAEG